MEPDVGLAAGAGDAVGELVGHPQPHVLQRRQDVGQRQLLAAAEYAEPRRIRRRAGRAAEFEREAVRARLLDTVDVADGGAGRDAVAVSGGERGAVAALQRGGAMFVVDGGEFVAQVVLPAAQRGGEARLDGRGAGRRRPGRGGGEHHVQARHRRVADMGVEGAADAGEGVLQDGRDGAPQARLVAFGGHEDEAGDGPAEAVAADEQAGARAFVEVEDAEGGVEQGVVVELEQFVAREGLEDVEERLAVVAAGREAGALGDAGGLAAQQRDVRQRRVVGAGGVEAEKAVDADHVAAGAAALDLDRVHMGLAVDGGAPGALADDQRVGVGEAGAHGGGQRAAARGAEVLALLGAAHDPERGAGDSLEERFAAGALREVVAAVADEGEMAVGDPAQERRDLVAVGVRRRGFGEFAHGVVERAAHGAPIGDGAADVLEDVRQARRQLGGVGGVLAADLDADGGFDFPRRARRRRRVRAARAARPKRRGARARWGGRRSGWGFRARSVRR